MWVKEAPKRRGHYWYKYRKNGVPQIGYLNRGILYQCGTHLAVDVNLDSRLYWSVPIPPPTEAADADKS